MNAADNLLKSGAAAAGWDGVAVIADDEILTYGDLAQRVASYAQGLRGHGVSRGDRVALRLRDSGDLASTLLAIMAIGAVRS